VRRYPDIPGFSTRWACIRIRLYKRAHPKPTLKVEAAMHIPLWFQTTILSIIDRFYRHRPYPMPDRARLENCKLISHRGEYDNRRVFENTFEAFDAVMAGGVWGIECDLRWTMDHQPVICHDNNLRRLYGSDVAINEMRLSDLLTAFPAIPTLEEAILRFGRRVHLMVEIKAVQEPGPHIQNKVLGELFSRLRPVADYHLISLDPSTLVTFDFLPTSALLPIAQLEIERFSRIVQEKNYGGLLGHYAWLTNQVIERHHGLGQQVGTGFVNSLNCLYRELNREVEWIFSDCAVRLQKDLSKILGKGGNGDAGKKNIGAR
jgi:glycerophosphoryl diester phosphodiesterase